MAEEFIILYSGPHTKEWETFEGTLEEAIQEVRRDHNYCNYGRDKAVVIQGRKVYEIAVESVEREFTE